MLDGDNPLPSYPRLAGKFGLAQLELAASVANDQPEVQGGSNLHDVPDVVERSQSDDVAERRLLQTSAFGHMEVAAFLATAESNSTTGQAITVDGFQRAV